MGNRGRQSAASLSVVGNVVAIPRPRAPVGLTDEQAAEWEAIVTRLPADWFGRETHPMLEAYVRHVVAGRRVAQLIERMESGADGDLDITAYDKLLAMQEREGRALSSLATRMRLSQHSTYDKKKSKPLEVPKPWE